MESINAQQNNVQVSKVQAETQAKPSFTANPNKPEQIADGDNKLRNVLLGLGVISAAGLGIYALKTGKLDKLKNFFSKKVYVDSAGEKFKNLPKFDPKNAAPGKYVDSSGNIITIDKYGTSIVDLKNGTYQVANGGVTKVYDATKTAPTRALATVSKNTGITKSSVGAAQRNVVVSGGVSEAEKASVDRINKLISDFYAAPSKQKYRVLAKLLHSDKTLSLPKDVRASLDEAFKNLTMYKRENTAYIL